MCVCVQGVLSRILSTESSLKRNKRKAPPPPPTSTSEKGTRYSIIILTPQFIIHIIYATTLKEDVTEMALNLLQEDVLSKSWLVLVCRHCPTRRGRLGEGTAPSLLLLSYCPAHW